MNIKYLEKSSKSGWLSAFLLIVGTLVVVNTVERETFITGDIGLDGMFFVITGWAAIVSGFVLGMRATYFAIRTYFFEVEDKSHE
jgi:uncharacterized membrane-anchored protein